MPTGAGWSLDRQPLTELKMIASYASSLKPAAPARSLPSTLAEMRQAAARYFTGSMPATLVNLQTAIGPVHVLPDGTIRVGHVLR